MCSRCVKNEDGQAIVEFAFTLTIALLVLCAVIDFGWLFCHELSLSTAVRDGARVGVTCTEDGDFESQVISRVKEEAVLCDAPALSVTSQYSDGDVIVNAVYNLEMLTPMAGIIFGGMSYPIETSCTMKAE